MMRKRVGDGVAGGVGDGEAVAKVRPALERVVSQIAAKRERLVLHLCGGAIPATPEDWIEMEMV